VEPVAADAGLQGSGIGSTVEIGRRGHLRVLRDGRRDGDRDPVR
jgi:hypothetical protein